MIPVRALSRWTVQRRLREEPDRCELCAQPLDPSHRHLFDRQRRRPACACAACALLFADGAHARFRPIPDRVRFDPSLRLRVEDWAPLGIPVELAFVRRLEAGGWQALLPGAAGMVEAELDPERWRRIRERSGLFTAPEPEVEALLFRCRRGGREVEVALLPIDRCFALAAILRTRWRGFDGGPEVREAIDHFLAAEMRRGEPWGGGR